MPEVSVIIPFYKRINWLAEAVQSVLNQTYKDFEIILIDDGSSEEMPPSIIEDGRIKYLRQENRGASAARNYGISVARGKYVAFLDSDDLFVATKLAKQVAYMNQHPDILLTHTSYQRMSKEGNDLEVMSSGKFSGRINRHVIFNCHIATPTVMVRRDALKEKMRFEESVMVGQGEDVILWLLFSTKSKVVGINEPLTKVRMHGNNVSLDANAQRMARMNVIRYVIEGNPDFDSAFSRHRLCSVYLDVADTYLSHRERYNCVKYLKKAWITRPLNRRIYRTLAQCIAPKMLMKIRNVRKSKSPT